jgi:hypothetical protein
MRTRNTIVTYREISKAIGNNEAATVQEIDGAAADPVESARMLAGFNAALKHLEEAEKIPGVLIAPDHRVASLLLSYVAERTNEKGEFTELPMGGKEAKFDSKDWLGWAGSFFTWWRQLNPHPFIAANAAADSLKDQVRVAVLGDWGTGLYGAPVCAQSIANDPKGYDVAVHLGDVYYSGTADEVKERFLDLWPRKAAINRAANSNHEMYTGGHAYFEHTLKAFGQASSCFALQNSHWLLVGLDTAYQDHDLTGGQTEWLQELLKDAGDRKVILMSHHQPFSWFEKGGEKLVAKLGGLLGGKKIFAWYWGHEHRCVLYDKHPVWGMYGRTIGHGGFPYFRDKVAGLKQVAPLWYQLESANLVPGGIVLDGPNEYVKGEEKKYGPHGYLSLQFDGPHLNEMIHAADGSVIYDRPLA